VPHITLPRSRMRKQWISFASGGRGSSCLKG
jgi:hypothetical protein